MRDRSVYVLDAFSLIYQVFHALPEMTGPSGQPVGAMYGFLRDVVEILDRKRPDYMICAMDSPGKTFRHGAFEAYKADRPPMPADLELQIPNIGRFLAALAIPVVSEEGYEADDLLATIARMVERMGGTCVLVTSDKDCRQLISDRTAVYNIRKDELIDAAALQQMWGIRPDQVVDLQALWGDSTDNVPGVPGIGQKTASQLLGEFGTLEGIYARIDEVKGKKREQLEQNREAAFLSRQLVRLADDVPIEIDWPAARRGGFDTRLLQELGAEFGFRGLIMRVAGRGLQLPDASRESSDRTVATPGAVAADRRDNQALAESYRTVATEESLAELVTELSRQSRVSVDTETTSTMPRRAELVGLSLAWQAGSAVYLPVRAPAGEPRLSEHRVLEQLRPVLEDPRIAKIGQNLKYDVIVLRNAGVALRGLAFDTMVADYLLAPGERSHGMDDLAKRYLGLETIKIRELIGTGRSQRRMDEVPVALVTAYASQDADIPLRLADVLARRLHDAGLHHLFCSLEMPLIDVLADMEHHGIALDVARLEQLSVHYGRRMDELEREVHEMAGGAFNLDSPRQLAKVLFEDFGLPVLKRTQTGPSTDASVLSQLAVTHELPARILEYRQLAKLKSTYVDALPALVHPRTGRVHTSFKQDVAATGRLSSTDPNLQNIPVRTPEGREIRAAFVAGEPGWRLLCADYSQIELRVLAHCSHDETLLQAFADERDIHAQVASEVHGVPLAEVTGAMRRAAKAINFGVIYGQSASGLASALGIAKEEAARFIDAYFRQYPGVDRFIERTLAEARKNGYVGTLMGRRRAVTGIRPGAGGDAARQRNLPERVAVNTVIQGSAADLIKQAMIRVHGAMGSRRMRARMLLQIHDELVFEAPGDELDDLAALVVTEMGAAGDLAVPLKVDVKTGVNWADCEPYAP
ncbi:MAG: DNA polymerase I [Planctomycetes bacterium]|nr:DNA polymerase I [Planctomycetota bacterium]